MNKALVLTTTSGFLSQFELNNVKLLQDRGYQIHYASNFGVPIYEVKDDTLKKMGIVLHHLSIRKSPFRIKENIWALKELIRIIDREQINLIHCHNPVGGLLGRIAARLSKRRPKVIYTAHGFHFFEGAPLKNWIFYYTVEKFLARFTDTIITINQEDYKRAEHFRYKAGGGAEIIPGVGVNTEEFHPSSNEDAGRNLREELNIPEDAFHIVSAGELNKNKNHSVVIKAIAGLARDDIYYSICGEGPYRETLEKLIRSLGMENRIFLRGYWYDMPRMYGGADLCVFPSHREGMGMAALEAMAMEVPLVASDNRGTREYMSDGNNGFVCDPDSSQEFARAILKIYENRELGRVMALNALDTLKRFTLDKSESCMKKIYDRFPCEETGTVREWNPSDPIVSVIMGVYNQEDRDALKASVDSILNQTLTNFEFLIYNDGSNSEVTEYINCLANTDDRISVFYSPVNRGLGFALNRCIDHARGKYLARMDADDVSHPDRFRKEVEFLESHPEYSWCGANCSIYDGDGVWGESKRPENPEARDYLKYSPYIHPTVMYRATLFRRVAGYAEDDVTRRCEDYELFMRLFRMGYKGYNIQEQLLKYFVDRNSYHSRPFKDCLCESKVRREGFKRMGLMWPWGWIYSLRPLVAALVPAGLVQTYKERTSEL